MVERGRRLLRHIAAALISATLLSAPSAAWANHKSIVQAPVTSGSLQLYASAVAAQAHCPKDEVVWLNTNSGIYHEKGMRWYGRTKAGAFVCKREADAAGDRDTRNGQ